MSYKLIIMPDGAVLPEDLAHLAVTTGDLLDRIMAGRESEVIIPVNARELQLLVEYRDLLDIDTKAIIGLQGAMYNSVWSMYVATMDRTNVDMIRSQLKDVVADGAKAGIQAANRPTVATRRERVLARDGGPKDDSSDQGLDVDGGA